MAVLLVLVGGALGCATVSAPEARRAERHPEASFLIDPLRGYPRSVSTAEAEVVRSGHEQLVSGMGTAGVEESVEALLKDNPVLEPAVLLRSQAAFVDGDYEGAFEGTLEIAERHPNYVAAQLLVARAAEKLDRVTDAFAAYLKVAPRSGLADRKSEALRPRALEITGNRLDDLLARGRLEEAAIEIGNLETWAPNDMHTWQAVVRYAAKTEDPARELEAVRRLIEIDSSTELLRRRALLELETGEAGEGLRTLEELLEQDPEDAELAQALDRAKFRWRLDLLPEDVVELLRRPELLRADHAKLLFWLFPDVRYGRASQGRIASDILDHPNRQEIVRVANLGLMRVDSTLHLFYPERAVTRREVLDSVLRVLGGRSPRPACLGELDPRARLSVDSLCRVAARCGLLPELGDCLPEATASGRFVESVGFAALDISESQ